MDDAAHLGSVFSESDSALLGAASPHWLSWAGVDYVVMGSGAGGVLALYRWTGSSFVKVDEIDAGAEFGFSQLLGISITEEGATEAKIALHGRGGSEVAILTVSDTGFGQSSDNGAMTYRGLDSMVAMDVAGNEFLILPQSNGSGLAVLSADVADDYAEINLIDDSATMALGDVVAIETIVVNGTSFVIATSAFDAGVSVFSIDQSGGLTHRDTVNPGDGSGFSLSQNLAVASFANADFAVLASAGSSSLTVFRVMEDGTLVETDHLIDTLETRFQSASHVKTIEVDGRIFVIAAGSDDGVSILELSPDGEIAHIGAIEDDFETALQNVSGLDVMADGTEMNIVVTSDADNGMSVYDVNTDQLEYLFLDESCDLPVPDAFSGNSATLSEDVFLI